MLVVHWTRKQEEKVEIVQTRVGLFWIIAKVEENNGGLGYYYSEKGERQQ